MPKTVDGRANKVLIETLKEARQKAGLTQAELAARIGRDQSFVSLFERYQRRVDTVEFVAICFGLGADPVELFATFVKKLRPGDIEM